MFIIPPITHIVTLIYSPLNLTRALFEGIVWYFGEFYKNFNDNQSWIKTDTIVCNSVVLLLAMSVHWSITLVWTEESQQLLGWLKSAEPAPSQIFHLKAKDHPIQRWWVWATVMSSTSEENVSTQTWHSKLVNVVNITHSKLSVEESRPLHHTHLQMLMQFHHEYDAYLLGVGSHTREETRSFNCPSHQPVWH